LVRKIKKKDHENLSESNISKVITLLNGETPISKKVACDMLNIAYNTTRLQRIIDDYQDKIEYREVRKKQNRGRGATNEEIREAVERYLSGDSIAEIAKGLFRSSGFVRSLIERVGVPKVERESGISILPESCIGESFAPGEIVWSAVYQKPARVDYELSVDYQAEKAGFSDVNYEKKYGSKCYAIYIMEEVREEADKWANIDKGGYAAYSLAYDLGKLSHLEKYGVDLSRI
jgi:hypothetical protein|tara:strand:- start:5021 stop:5716 length:696 start_codon:yes stop_codon:yes gene_type:complete